MYWYVATEYVLGGWIGRGAGYWLDIHKVFRLDGVKLSHNF